MKNKIVKRIAFLGILVLALLTFGAVGCVGTANPSTQAGCGDIIETAKEDGLPCKNRTGSKRNIGSKLWRATKSGLNLTLYVLSFGAFGGSGTVSSHAVNGKSYMDNAAPITSLAIDNGNPFDNVHTRPEISGDC